MAADRIVLLDDVGEVSFSFEDMLSFHGGASPGGVAHGFKVLERALPLLDQVDRVERRELVIETAFGGPGARDAFELVTHAVSEGRFVLHPSLARPEFGRGRERFVFRLRYRDRVVTLVLREGFVADEFIDLTRSENRTAEQDHRLALMKIEMANRVMSATANEVYAVASCAIGATLRVGGESC